MSDFENYDSTPSSLEILKERIIPITPGVLLTSVGAPELLLALYDDSSTPARYITAITTAIVGIKMMKNSIENIIENEKR